ncbi:unnamed protein product [Durusdinium trenchii]|uniref:Uncharacterized protein n=1 Tax=Durusdinium trenchii TaxID=1381693 RepID=A0ABP0HYV0_9DINO
MVITLRPFRLGFFTFLGFFDRPSEAATYAIDAHGHSRALMRQEATNRQASLEEGDPDNDCVWGDWQDWTQCTVTCGNGMRTRQKSQESIGEAAVSGEVTTTDAKEAADEDAPVAVPSPDQAGSAQTFGIVLLLVRRPETFRPSDGAKERRGVLRWIGRCYEQRVAGYTGFIAVVDFTSQQALGQVFADFYKVEITHDRLRQLAPKRLNSEGTGSGNRRVPRDPRRGPMEIAFVAPEAVPGWSSRRSHGDLHSSASSSAPLRPSSTSWEPVALGAALGAAAATSRRRPSMAARGGEAAEEATDLEKAVAEGRMITVEESTIRKGLGAFFLVLFLWQASLVISTGAATLSIGGSSYSTLALLASNAAGFAGSGSLNL